MNNLKACRSAIGLTQKELGTLVGCTPGSISHWESGKRQISVKICQRLITIFIQHGVNTSMDNFTFFSIKSSKGDQMCANSDTCSGSKKKAHEKRIMINASNKNTQK